jgi:hypothetical protein
MTEDEDRAETELASLTGGSFKDASALEDLRHTNAPPLSVRQVAKQVGMSPTFIRTEIHGGHLQAAAIGHGKKRVFRIPAAEARRYARSLGLR